jgi:hypothetical protein
LPRYGAFVRKRDLCVGGGRRPVPCATRTDVSGTAGQDQPAPGFEAIGAGWQGRADPGRGTSAGRPRSRSCVLPRNGDDLHGAVHARHGLARVGLSILLTQFRGCGGGAGMPSQAELQWSRARRWPVLSAGSVPYRRTDRQSAWLAWRPDLRRRMRALLRPLSASPRLQPGAVPDGHAQGRVGR